MARVAASDRPVLDMTGLSFESLETETVYTARTVDPMASVPGELKDLVEKLYASGNENLAVYVPQGTTVQAQELARLAKVYGANRAPRLTVIPVLVDDEHKPSDGGRIVRLRVKVYTARPRKVEAAEGAKSTK